MAKPSGHRADVQGLRGLAVLLVVAFHAGLPIRGGYVGVDIFFVISGFVITAMILRELEASDGLSLVRFYARRVRRILPALAVMLLAVASAATFLLSPLDDSIQLASKTGAASSTFVANALLADNTDYFAPSAEKNPLLHTWSLAVEEQFYLIFPVMMALGWRLSRRKLGRFSPRFVLGTSLALGTIGSFVLSLALQDSPVLNFYSSPTRAWEFAIGALVALATPKLMRLGKKTAVISGIVGSILIGIAATTFSAATPFPGAAALLPVFGAALMVVAGTPSSRGFGRIFSGKPLARIGDLSYSWYLWHWPAIVLGRVLWPNAGWAVPLVAAGSLSVAWVSYRWVETPIRFNPRISGWRIPSLGAVCIGVPVLACALLFRLASPAFDTATIAHLRQETRYHADVIRGCDSSVPIAQRTGLNCTWPADDSRGTVFLVGDSNAGQLTEPLASAAHREGYTFTVATNSGCPFVDLRVSFPSLHRHPDGCLRFVKESVAELKRVRPQLVVIASAGSSYVNDSDIEFRNSAGFTAGSASEKAHLWTEGLASLIQELGESGTQVLVVHTVPHFENSLSSCAAFRLRAGATACGSQLSRKQVEVQQRLARTAEESAIAGSPLAMGADFTNELCNVSVCATNNGNSWLYRDGTHLSVRGAFTLSDRFSELIRLHAGTRAPGGRESGA